jgi:hypothetical protein
MTARSVRTTIVPRHTCTPLGQRTFTLNHPDLLTVNVVPTSVAIGAVGWLEPAPGCVATAEGPDGDSGEGTAIW